jgi:sec-independent protein translocase protein TatB
MIDIGFPELVIIAIVSLIVIGPEQLPSTLRTLALWFGRLKRGFNDLRREIEHGIGADEIKQQLHNEAILKEIEKSKAAIADTALEASSLVKAQDQAFQSTGQENTSERPPHERN